MKRITITDEALNSLTRHWNTIERTYNRAVDKDDWDKANECCTKQCELLDTLKTLGFQFEFDYDDEKTPLKAITHESEPADSLDHAVEKAEKVLYDAGVDCVVYGDPKFGVLHDEVVVVYITWGDWKHDHARADYVLEAHGFQKIDEVSTDGDGGDCYSAEHIYNWK